MVTVVFVPEMMKAPDSFPMAYQSSLVEIAVNSLYLTITVCLTLSDMASV